MAKGALAKEDVAKKLAAAFGADYLGEYDKKYYVYGYENGEKVQIAIAMTCPKTPVEFTPVVTSGYVQTGDWNFDDDVPAAVTTTATAPSAPVEITQEERNNIAELMARLGL